MGDIGFFCDSITLPTANFSKDFKFQPIFIITTPSHVIIEEGYGATQRAVQLMEQCNNILPINKDERQFLLQVVKYYRCNTLVTIKILFLKISASCSSYTQPSKISICKDN